MDALSIRSVLEEIISTVEKYELLYWSEILKKIQSNLVKAYSSGHAWAIKEILEDLDSMYGGMGSFNDFVISPHDNLQVKRGEISAANERLNYLRDRLYELIQEEKACLQRQE